MFEHRTTISKAARPAASRRSTALRAITRVPCLSARSVALVALMIAVIAALGTAAGPVYAIPIGACDTTCTTPPPPPPPPAPRGGEVGCHDCSSSAPKQKLVTVYRSTYAYSTPYLNARSRKPIRAGTYAATCEANSGSRGRHSNPWWSRLREGT